MTQPGYTTTQTQALQENAERLGLVWKKRAATIVAPESDDPTGVTAVMDGDTVAINVYSLIGFLPVGARVMCDLVPPSGIYVVGFIGSPNHLGTMNMAIQRLSPNLSTASTTYVLVPGTNFTFVKRYTRSRLAVSMKVGGYANSVPPFNALVGIRVFSTDFDICRHLYNIQTTHLAFGGDMYVDDITPYPAGNIPMQAIAKVDNATKTFVSDGNDLYSIIVTEVL